jgi:hypothetical protein
MTTTILIADVAPWAKVIVTIVVMLVIGINKWFAAQNDAKQKAARPRPAKPRPVPPAVQQQVERRQMEIVRDDVKAEVQAFLRQAEEKKQGKPSLPVAPAVRQPKPKKPPKPQSQPTAQPVARRRLGESVAEHVAEHLQTGEFARRASVMTDDLARADQARQEHFDKTFSHQLGRLEDTSSSVGAPGAPAAAASPAVNLVELLRDPANIRHVIVMNEVLNRPQW